MSPLAGRLRWVVQRVPGALVEGRVKYRVLNAKSMGAWGHHDHLYLHHKRDEKGQVEVQGRGPEREEGCIGPGTSRVDSRDRGGRRTAQGMGRGGQQCDVSSTVPNPVLPPRVGASSSTNLERASTRDHSQCLDPDLTSWIVPDRRPTCNLRPSAFPIHLFPSIDSASPGRDVPTTTCERET